MLFFEWIFFWGWADGCCGKDFSVFYFRKILASNAVFQADKPRVLNSPAQIHKDNNAENTPAHPDNNSFHIFSLNITQVITNSQYA